LSDSFEQTSLTYFLKKTQIDFQLDCPLAPFTSWKIGGPATCMINPATISELQEAYQFLIKNRYRHYILGGGSNLLFDDQGFQGVIIYTGKLNSINIIESTSIQALAGYSVDKLADFAQTQGLGGLEFAAGLPGSLGGAIYMNARCYGGEFSQKIISVDWLDQNATLRSLSPSDCHFHYKDSIFQHQPGIILGCRLQLNPENPQIILNRMKENRHDRVSKGQFDYPSAGCVFKNNYQIGIPSGKLIETLGMKGTRINDIEIYPKHANFFINRGNGTARDILELIQIIHEKILQKYQIKLEEEIVYVPYQLS